MFDSIPQCFRRTLLLVWISNRSNSCILPVTCMDCTPNNDKIFCKLEDDSKQVCFYIFVLNWLWNISGCNCHLLLWLEGSSSSNADEFLFWDFCHNCRNDLSNFGNVSTINFEKQPILIQLIPLYVLYRISKETKKQQGFWKRYLWFLAILALASLTVWAYATFASAMSSISQDLQWILALASPLLREILIWLMQKICLKAAKGSEPHRLMVCHYMEARHAVFLSIVLGGIATTESSYCIIAIGFLINIYHILKILKRSHAGEHGMFHYFGLKAYCKKLKMMHVSNFIF